MLKNGSVWKNARSKLETISNECSGAYCYDAVGLRNGDAPAYSRTLVTVTVARCPSPAHHHMANQKLWFCFKDIKVPCSFSHPREGSSN